MKLCSWYRGEDSYLGHVFDMKQLCDIVLHLRSSNTDIVISVEIDYTSVAKGFRKISNINLELLNTFAWEWRSRNSDLMEWNRMISCRLLVVINV